VVAAKQAFDDASATSQKALDERRALEVKIEEIESKLRKAGWKP
jgi:hypothetical protein